MPIVSIRCLKACSSDTVNHYTHERQLKERSLTSRPRAGSVPWEEYIHVYQPTTECLSGLGRMWNIKKINGESVAYYKTVVLVPYSTGKTPVTPPKGEVTEITGELGGGGGFR
ncbi:MAG: hypothetical protein PHX16_03560 [Syntrophaceticus sp.]|nr:hypothetical protein [Syntrophaceticus sp.]MDD4360173.1 hypothetical protein [Syntrophaceticus sp.]MDD4782710.1 hypothetical protein [Syntrophaceticus sp.]